MSTSTPRLLLLEATPKCRRWPTHAGRGLSGRLGKRFYTTPWQNKSEDCIYDLRFHPQPLIFWKIGATVFSLFSTKIRMISHEGVPVSPPQLPQILISCQSPEKIVQMRILIQRVWNRAPDPAFLTGFSLCRCYRSSEGLACCALDWRLLRG